MRLSSPTEQLVEDAASIYFGAVSAPTKRGVEIDDAGERGDPSQVMLKGRLAAALHRLNPHLPHDTIEEVVRILSRPPHPTLIQNSRWFHAMLTDSIEIECRDAKSGETRGDRARLVDFENPAANELLVVRQLRVAGPSGKIIRPDLTMFLNGLPVAMIELKDPTDTKADLGVAIEQFDRYMQTAPDLFVSNLVLVVSDGMLTRVGSITSGSGRFMPWRPIDDREGGGAPTLEALIRCLFDPRDVGRLSADLCHLRGGRAWRDRQKDRGLPPVPRGAQGACQRACSSQAAVRHGRRSRGRDLAHPRARASR